jgi:hypothetical protein
MTKHEAISELDARFKQPWRLAPAVNCEVIVSAEGQIVSPQWIMEYLHDLRHYATADARKRARELEKS